MTHKFRHKQLQRIKQKYKNLAGIVAAATIFSAAMLPGMPGATAHASANPGLDHLSASTSQEIGKTADSGAKINFDAAKAPIKNTNKENKSQSINKESPKITQKATEKSTKEAIPKVQEKVKKETKTPEVSEKSAEKTAPTPTKATPAPKENKESSSTAPSNFKEVLDISATAYAPGPHDNGQWGNKTHIGSQVRPGIIAVDPSVIPLGSRVYIEYPDGHGEYAVAEDTGGAIKGNRVDVAKSTVNEAKDFGIQKVKVYVVNTPEKA